VAAASFTGNGTGLTSVNAAMLNGFNAGSFWQLGGNNVGPAQFLGSMNNQPVEIRVNNARALRLEPNTNGAPNVIGGSPNNCVSNGVIGATISGGGTADNTYSGQDTNTVSANFGTVGGGTANTATDWCATVGGGARNTASGWATVGGGNGNTASGRSATVGGGNGNTASGWGATVGGGESNSARGTDTTVGGGVYNAASTADRPPPGSNLQVKAATMNTNTNELKSEPHNPILMRNSNFETAPPSTIVHVLSSTLHPRSVWLLLLALALPLAARGQSYSIDWWTVDGGGGTSTGGVYSVSGTMGQPDDGQMSGGNYTLDGGFWSLVAAVQTPGAPLLTITHTPTNSVIICWPSPSTGFGLQQNGDVANPNGWSAFAGAISDNGTTRSVTISPPAGNLLFRLKQQ